MKTVAQILLIIFFVIFFFIAFISATAKFRLLDYNFWIKVLRANNVYSELSDTVKSSVNLQVGKEGGNIKDIAILTDLVTSENTKDFVEENLLNFTNFINTKTPDLKVFIPVSKIPTGLIPKNFSGVKDEMTIGDLQNKFNIVGLDQLPLKNINSTGLVLYYSILTAGIFTVLTFVLTLILVEPGKRLIAPAAELILSGFVALSSSQILNNTISLLSSSSMNTINMNSQVLRILLTPIVREISIIWNYVGIGALVLGVFLLFIKKPGIKKFNERK